VLPTWGARNEDEPVCRMPTPWLSDRPVFNPGWTDPAHARRRRMRCGMVPEIEAWLGRAGPAADEPLPDLPALHGAARRWRLAARDARSHPPAGLGRPGPDTWRRAKHPAPLSRLQPSARPRPSLQRCGGLRAGGRRRQREVRAPNPESMGHRDAANAVQKVQPDRILDKSRAARQYRDRAVRRRTRDNALRCPTCQRRAAYRSELIVDKPPRRACKCATL